MAWSSLVIRMPKGDSIKFPARGIKQISEEAFTSPECQRVYQARSIIKVSQPIMKSIEKFKTETPSEIKKKAKSDVPNTPKSS